MGRGRYKSPKAGPTQQIGDACRCPIEEGGVEAGVKIAIGRISRGANIAPGLINSLDKA